LSRSRIWESSSAEELCSELPSDVFSCTTSPAAHTQHTTQLAYHTACRSAGPDIPAFYGQRKFITMSTRARCWALS
jgi:hypothetical protein